MHTQANTRDLLIVLAASLLCLGARAALSQTASGAPAPDQSSVPADNSRSNSTDPSNQSAVAANGRVTLNGVVRSDQEKADVEAKAVSVVGQGNVVNDLKVSPKP